MQELQMHEASAITYGQAKEGGMEVHNFNEALDVTSMHSNNQQKDNKSLMSDTLARSIYSITEDKESNKDKQMEEEAKVEYERGGQQPGKKIRFFGMDMVEAVNQQCQESKPSKWR